MSTSVDAHEQRIRTETEYRFGVLTCQNHRGNHFKRRGGGTVLKITIIISVAHLIWLGYSFNNTSLDSLDVETCLNSCSTHMYHLTHPYTLVYVQRDKASAEFRTTCHGIDVVRFRIDSKVELVVAH